MSILSCYNSYIDKTFRRLLIFIYPIVVLIFAAIVILLLRNVSIVQGLFVIVPISTLLVYFLVDRLTVGPVYANWGKEDELLKSSPVGKKLFENVMMGEYLIRIYLSVVLFGGMLLLTFIPGIYLAYYSKLIPTAILCMIAVHAVSSVMVNALRGTEGITVAWIAWIGTTYTLTPAFFAILIGNIIALWIMCVIYLVMDVIANIISKKSVDRLVNDKWYKDSPGKWDWNTTN